MTQPSVAANQPYAHWAAEILIRSLPEPLERITGSPETCLPCWPDGEQLTEIPVFKELRRDATTSKTATFRIADKQELD